MLYPFKFKTIFKDYLWGGRNLLNLGKALPSGIVAESWEISTHKAGESIIDNGRFSGISLKEIIEIYPIDLLGTEVVAKVKNEFPLLIKFIDANEKLSVQVHPNDEYAHKYENGQNGKNEMWYIISAKPNSKLVYGLKDKIDKNTFIEAVQNNTISTCLNYVTVKSGDIINIPAGMVHAIGKGILICEIQQSCDLTYRIYDYDRTDSNGNKRPLHIKKALDVIDFNNFSNKNIYKGLKININKNSFKTYIVLNNNFCVELYDVKEQVLENTDLKTFHSYTCIEGFGEIIFRDGSLKFKIGESILIPAILQNYSLKGKFKAVKCYMLSKFSIENKIHHIKHKYNDIQNIITDY